MTEPTVQVPVSLIERIPHGIDCDYYATRKADCPLACSCVRGLFDALLSQPTPTAEPDCTCGYGGVHEPMNPRCARNGYEWVEPQAAEPPRIEDMAPGTTFYAALVGEERVEQWMRVNSCHPVARMRDGFHRWARHLDPSTIRDVRPPVEQSVPESGTNA